MQLTQNQIQQFQKEILDWYKKNKRDLPWRYPSPHGLYGPYKILVSEVMSQQTQLSRVVPKYLEWMDAFPTLESLAKASTRDVLSHWSGLGYNRRALYLQKTAQVLVKGQTEETKVKWPQTEKELMQLPGIGTYTARAILCFGFNQQVAVVDTNVRKVILTRIMNDELRIKHEKEVITNKDMQEIAEQLLPVGKAYEWNQALMDYASAELKNTKVPTLLRQGYGRAGQSKFKDSDRYFRGQTIKILLKENKQSFEVLFKNAQEHSKVDSKRYKKILRQLQTEGFVKKEKSTISLF